MKITVITGSPLKSGNTYEYGDDWKIAGKVYHTK